MEKPFAELITHNDANADARLGALAPNRASALAQHRIILMHPIQITPLTPPVR